MAYSALHKAVLLLFLNQINAECCALCRRSQKSKFRCIPASELPEFQWDAYICELQSKAPLLFQVLSTLVSRNDQRNEKKVGSAHYPAICTAAAVTLKEQNREMCRIQAVISMVLFASHANKQVKTCNYQAVLV